MSGDPKTISYYYLSFGLNRYARGNKLLITNHLIFIVLNVSNKNHNSESNQVLVNAKVLSRPPFPIFKKKKITPMIKFPEGFQCSV